MISGDPADSYLPWSILIGVILALLLLVVRLILSPPIRVAPEQPPGELHEWGGTREPARTHAI